MPARSFSRLREWVAGLDETQAPRDINWWLWLRWTTQMHVYDTALADDARRSWAELFLVFVDCMERFAAYDSWRAATDRFNLRALLIRDLGQVDNSPTWNVEALTHDVLAMLTLSAAQAREEARHWQSLPMDQIRTLRRHKNALAPLESIARLLGSSPDADLAREWLTLRPDLP